MIHIQLGDYNPIYKAEHHDAKGIVNEFLKGQPSFLGDKLSWTSITTGVYFEMLKYVSSFIYLSINCFEHYYSLYVAL